jgi:putative glutamine amidotransferase
VRPVIGINCNYGVKKGSQPRYYVDRAYCTAVELEGGLPILLPTACIEGDHAEAYLGMLSGLVISGGTDVDPSRYGQELHPTTQLVVPEKEEFDLRLVKGALEMDMPVMGICYGEQLLNICLGGSLFQDMPSDLDAILEHNDPPGGYHKVLIEKDTILYRLLGVDAMDTNSIHHQSVDRLGDGLRACARTEDGVVEAVESERHRFVLGIQWHPERVVDLPLGRRLFSGFMKEARAYASRRV